MIITGIGYALSGLVGAGIVAIGARFLLAPATAAAAYGVPADPETGSAGAYLAVKGVRDIASGLFVFILIAARQPHVLPGRVRGEDGLCEFQGDSFGVGEVGGVNRPG
jgi:hypothetical protein